MKKLTLGLASFLAIVISSLTFAAAPDMSAYYSTLHPGVNTMRTTMVPATNITVLNYSQEGIFVVVPNTPINDWVISGKNDIIKHDTYYGSTSVILQDPNRNTFWSGEVCRLAIIKIQGGPGSYNTNITNC